MTLEHTLACHYLHDGPRRLNADQRAALEAHLAECAGCRVYAAELQALAPVLFGAMQNRWDNPPRRAGLTPHLQHRLRQAASRRRAFLVASPVASLVMLVLLVWLNGILAHSAAPQASARQTTIAAMTALSTSTPSRTPSPIPKIDRYAAPDLGQDSPTMVPNPVSLSNKTWPMDLQPCDLSACWSTFSGRLTCGVR